MYDLSNKRDKLPDLKGQLSRLDRDLWAIPIIKTEDTSEEADKLKVVRAGERLWAYVRIHKWLNQTTEQGMVKKMVSIRNRNQ